MEPKRTVTVIGNVVSNWFFFKIAITHLWSSGQWPQEIAHHLWELQGHLPSHCNAPQLQVQWVIQTKAGTTPQPIKWVAAHAATAASPAEPRQLVPCGERAVGRCGQQARRPEADESKESIAHAWSDWVCGQWESINEREQIESLSNGQGQADAQTLLTTSTIFICFG